MEMSFIQQYELMRMVGKSYVWRLPADITVITAFFKINSAALVLLICFPPKIFLSAQPFIIFYTQNKLNLIIKKWEKFS